MSASGPSGPLVYFSLIGGPKETLNARTSFTVSTGHSLLVHQKKVVDRGSDKK